MNEPQDEPGRTKDFKPYVPAETSLAEMTLRALLLGVLMAVVLGAANAYLGMKAGLTVAATFPAAVVAMAALRPFRGLDPGGEHRPHHGLGRRGSGGRRHFHDSRLCDQWSLG